MSDQPACLVVGSPIAHSLSPAMHRAAYRAAELDWTYEALEIAEGQLAESVAAMDRTVRGISVTAPLKREAARLANHRSAVVEDLGVANTLVRSDDGWSADNTDVPGIVNALTEAGAGVGSVRILGAGATAVAVAHATASMGGTDIELVVRDPRRAAETAEVARATGARISVVTFEQYERGSVDPCERGPVDLLVSTVPDAATRADADAWVAAAGAVFDVVYDPWPTSLASAAERHEIPVVSGLDLLAHQAVLQLQLMAGIETSPDVLREAALAELASRR